MITQKRMIVPIFNYKLVIILLGDKMKNANIKNINILLSDDKKIIALPEMFDNFYISNLNNKGEEIAFISKENSNRLTANFIMIKLSDEIIEYNLTNNNIKENAFKLLKENKIKEIDINFKNGYSQPFMFNITNDTYIIKNPNNLCLLLSDIDIKYKDNLFA